MRPTVGQQSQPLRRLKLWAHLVNTNFAIPVEWEGVIYADIDSMEPWKREELRNHIARGGEIPFSTMHLNPPPLKELIKGLHNA